MQSPAQTTPRKKSAILASDMPAWFGEFQRRHTMVPRTALPLSTCLSRTGAWAGQCMHGARTTTSISGWTAPNSGSGYDLARNGSLTLPAHHVHLWMSLRSLLKPSPHLSTGAVITVWNARAATSIGSACMSHRKHSSLRQLEVLWRREGMPGAELDDADLVKVARDKVRPRLLQIHTLWPSVRRCNGSVLLIGARVGCTHLVEAHDVGGTEHIHGSLQCDCVLHHRHRHRSGSEFSAAV